MAGHGPVCVQLVGGVGRFTVRVSPTADQAARLAEIGELEPWEVAALNAREAMKA
jgi:hypothetical protein